MPGRNLLIALVMALAGVLAIPQIAAAQTAEAPTAVALPDPLTTDAIDALVSRLSDEQVRQLLLQQLEMAAKSSDAPGAVAPAPQDIMTVLTETLDRSVARFVFNATHLPMAVAAEAEVVAGYIGDLGTGGLTTFLAVFALAIALGIAAEILLYRFVIKGKIPPQTESASLDLFDMLPVIGRRLLREMAGTIVFFIVVTLVLRFAMPAPDAPIAHTVVRWLIFLPRITLAVLRFIFAPHRADLRIVRCDDWTARYLFRNFFGITLTVGIALFLLALNDHRGAPQSADRIGFWFNLLVFVWLGVTFVRARDGLRSIMRGRFTEQSRFEAHAIRIYPWFGLAAIICTWMLAQIIASMGQTQLLEDGRHLISLAVLLIAPLLDTVIRALVLHFVPPMRGEGRVAQRAYNSNIRAYTRMGRVLVFGAVLLVTAKLWDVTLMNMASAGVGEQFAIHLVQALMIGVVGYLFWEVTRLLINRRLADEMSSNASGPPPAESDVPHIGAPPSSRLGTVLPPISWALQAVIITLTVLTALGNLGIDVTPLLAGAGIAGIAIGFGAQKLVSDIMSGLFFLIDDAFRLNEYIDVGGTVGTVERISLRSIQLRDAKGPVLIIPYSNIKTVTNFGRDWGIMKLKFTVPFDTDLEKVRKIFKKIGAEMMADPVLAPGFIEPFKSQGVGEFNEYGIVVRGKFMHKPGAQFGIRKQIFKRVQEEFAANDIQFARREVRVSISDGEGGEHHLSEEQAHQIGAAAAETVAADERAKAAAAASKT